MTVTVSADFQTSELLRRAGFTHAFFTRQGGVSSGRYASLNFAANVGDRPGAVRENCERAGSALGVSGERLFWLAQEHGTESVELSGDEACTDVRSSCGDALFSACGSLALGVQTADCVPVLLADDASGLVAAIHCGWRGVVQGIVPGVIARLDNSPGKRRWLAAIGPHISAAAFEVSPEVARELARAATDDVVIWRSGPKPFVDLRLAVRRQLERCALGAAAIDDVEGCTMTDAARYFSYRRDGKRGGRHLSAIRPRVG